jgi:hypothetical protein
MDRLERTRHVLAAKIDESAARTGEDFAVTNTPNFVGSSFLDSQQYRVII